MDKIDRMWYGPLPADSSYMKPIRLFYEQNGVEKNWDMLKVHDSVVIIIANTTRKCLLFVKQFRPVIYYGITSAITSQEVDLVKYPPQIGVTIEFCAGIVDKDKPLAQIARDEVLEECGYDIPVDRIEHVLTYRADVGKTGSQQVLFYCEVTDDEKIPSEGRVVDDEMIDVVEMTIPQVRAMVSQGANICSPPSCLLGIFWFLANKADIFD